jgi:hypothetical protein
MHIHYLWTYFMLGTPSSGKTFFIRYLTKYYMLLKKKVILTTTIGCATSRFSSKASTVHNTFHIQCKGYVWPLQELNVEFQIFKKTNIIIIDAMSMMMSTLLQSVENRLRKIENDTNEPYHSKLVILVGDHAQLPTICHCHLLDTENYCQKFIFIMQLIGILQCIILWKLQ